jgi:hypothetical protein
MPVMPVEVGDGVVVFIPGIEGDIECPDIGEVGELEPDVWVLVPHAVSSRAPARDMPVRIERFMVLPFRGARNWDECWQHC